MHRLIRIFILLIGCMLFNPLHARMAPGFDLVTMKNGDYHHGTVAHEQFLLDTDYGNLSIPYLQMRDLKIQQSMAVINTRLGERFSGRLRSEYVTLLRNHQPMLQLHMDDIAQIDFTPRSHRQGRISGRDIVELTNGDRFYSLLALSDLMMKTDDGIKMTSVNDIFIVDFARHGEASSLRTQLTLNNQDIIQGELLAISAIEAKTRYGPALKLPLASILSLALKVNFKADGSGFDYRRHINPVSLLQDRMVDGLPGPEMVIVRGGAYQRGDYQGNGDTDEKPLTMVKPSAFAIGIYEVSFAEYDRFCEDTRRDKPDDSGWGRGQRPVVNVSWNDALAYTQWLSRKTRQTYRLPTDAEWEYAARSGSKTRYWWGNEIKPAYANCAGCGSIWDGEKTAPVGKFPANGFGLHDTAGNVFEWVLDCFHTDFSAAPKDGSALDKPGCGKRVIRGGAWSFPVKEVRSANRWRDFPSRRSDDTGFRVVRELDNS